MRRVKARQPASRLRDKAQATIPMGSVTVDFFGAQISLCGFGISEISPVVANPTALASLQIVHGPIPQEGTKTLKISATFSNFGPSRTSQRVNLHRSSTTATHLPTVTTNHQQPRWYAAIPKIVEFPNRHANYRCSRPRRPRTP